MSILDNAKSRAQGLAMAALTKAVALAPDKWIPGSTPDPLIRKQNGHVGKPLSRLDGPLKVAGQARFSAEVALPNMAYAAIVHADTPKGRIALLDTAAAEAVPGVVLVMTHRNAPRMNPMPVFMSAAKAAGPDALPILQDDRIHWSGQPVAVVVAETQEIADEAAGLIAATFKEEPAVTAFAAARAKGTQQGSFMAQPLRNEIGDAEAALAAAHFRVDARYTTPRHNHNAIELHALTCEWQDDGVLRIHDTTQMVAQEAWTIGRVFGLSEDKVVVTSPFVGGGFGGKGLWQHQACAAAAAKLTKRPVRLMLSRESVYRIVGGRAPTDQRVALGATAEGKLTALIHTGLTAKSPASPMPEPFILPTRSAYAAETMLLDVKTVEIESLSNTFMRAPGEAVGTFALECAIDELAEVAGIDPIELRLRNEPEKDPVSGLPFSGRHLDAAYRMGAEKFGWDRRSPTPRARREGEWWVGMGCATGTYPYYRMPGGAARITLTGEGATIDIAAHEMGMGTATAATQVAADRLGLSPEAIAFNYGDSTLPGTVMAGGSQQTASIGASIVAAHRALVAELVKLAGNDSPIAGAKPDELSCRDAGLCRADDEAAYESYASILARANRPAVSAEASPPLPLEMMHWSMHSHAAMFAEVRVNAVTGEVRVSRFLGSFDCGRILNPKTAASQFRGGIIMGLGLALMEETQFDERKGRVMNASLAEYHLPVHLDVPDIEVIWTDIPDPHTPMGARGIGEIGITGTGAAVANAIYNAIGKRVRDLPITLDKLL